MDTQPCHSISWGVVAVGVKHQSDARRRTGLGDLHAAASQQCVCNAEWLGLVDRSFLENLIDVAELCKDVYTALAQGRGPTVPVVGESRRSFDTCACGCGAKSLAEFFDFLHSVCVSGSGVGKNKTAFCFCMLTGFGPPPAPWFNVVVESESFRQEK